MTSDDVIASLNVIKYYNPNMANLYDSWVEYSSAIDTNRDEITAAEEAGEPLWETLARIEVGLANVIHDYVYQVLHPFDSVIVKNVIREQMTRDIFGFDANF